MRFVYLAILALTGLFGLMAGPSYAQATRTWVSGVGDDANPCSRTAPCKTFAGAISKTAAKGEINCLDNGGFGGLTITKSLSVVCNNVIGGVLVSGTNGFVVNMPGTSDVALLDGLDFEGLTTGINGVRMIGSGKLIIRNTTIRNFSAAGVDMQAPATSPAPRVLLQNVLITGNGGGFNVAGPSGASNNGVVVDSVIDSNARTTTSYGIQVAAGGSVVVSGSTLTGNNPSAIVVTGNGQVISYGNNVIRGNGSPTSTLPLQ